MRIQHNIAALNSHRNLTNNNSAVAKNLEKLSSGYRINRAGDDAAGLAISEKMRAQITGLETAQKNAQDGISLVQTAEGALTEVHSMLNRMVELADQSANGTYDDKIDRENLQKEIASLKDEIDRIADATNFNGINLLDGSLSSKGTSRKADVDLSNLGNLSASVTEVDAVKGKYEMQDAITAPTADMAEGDALNFSYTVTDSNGKSQVVNIALTMQADEGGKLTKLVAADGTEYKVNTEKKPTQDEITNALVAELSKNGTIGDNFKVTGASGKVTFEAKTAGTAAPQVTDIAMSTYAKGTDTTTAVKNAIDVKTKAEDAFDTIDLSKATIFDGKNLDKAAFEINGEKFVFIENGKVDADTLAAMKEAGVEHYVEVATPKTIGDADVKAMAEKIAMETGLKVEQGEVAADGTWGADISKTQIALKPNTTGKAGGGLTLQIGDTADDFNQLTVSVGDMHAKALGIGGIDISTQAGAKDAVQKIKDAINSVSSTRGDLGAIQNRLEHTINNLSVTTENMTAAESRIRDVDMAKEMMAYTKNNILVQASQAMLAQANQLPQGVLQLLQ